MSPTCGLWPLGHPLHIPLGFALGLFVWSFAEYSAQRAATFAQQSHNLSPNSRAPAKRCVP